MKTFENMSDAECAVLESATMCRTHGQPLLDCANIRLKQVKAARQMDERSMASARAWEKLANETRLEIQRLQGLPK